MRTLLPLAHFFRRALLPGLAASAWWWGVARGAEPENPARTWTLRDGKQITGELLAADGLRMTLGEGGVPKRIVALSVLSATDLEEIRTWQTGRMMPSLIDPRLLAPWPAQASAETAEVRATGEDAGRFLAESPHFRVSADVKLPENVLRDLMLVFEGTREALIALPLGLHAGGEREKYPVLMTTSAESYRSLGGGAGSGGFYEGRTRRMLVLLPNLGIEPKGTGFNLRYAGNLFVLKHEVTHQLLARWHRQLPYWLNEGLPEWIASLPYNHGRYNLRNAGAGMRDYLLKWRKSQNDKTVRLIPPARLMPMRMGEWNEAVAQGKAYDLYNSAGLLAYYFIQQDGGAPLAGFLDALRRGVDVETAEKEHLLHGKTREALAAELVALGKKLGVEVRVD
jgi:hypothetical protein